MLSLNNSLINFIFNKNSYSKGSAEIFPKEKSSDKSQENYSSASDSSDNDIAAKHSVSLRRELRYKLLSYNFSIDKRRELNCLNSTISHFHEFEHGIKFLISNKLNEIGKIYSEGVNLITQSHGQCLISFSAALSMISLMDAWYVEITSKLDDFNVHARNLLAEKMEKVAQIKNRLNDHHFDKTLADSLVQELEAVKKDPSLDERIKIWDRDYLNTLLSLNQHQAALHYARAKQLQREIGGQVFA